MSAVALILLGSLAVFWMLSVPSADEYSTEFYLLGSGRLAEDYPRQASSGEALSVIVGIANKERDEHSYRVEAWAVDPWANRQQLVQRIDGIVLKKGESLEQPIEWQIPWAGNDQQVEFYLFNEDDEGTEPYRLLRLWLDVVNE